MSEPTTRRAVIGHLRTRGPSRSTWIAEDTGRPYKSVANACTALVTEGVIESASRPGFRACQYKATGKWCELDLDAIHELVDAYGEDAVIIAARGEHD